MRPGGSHCLPGSGLEKKGQKRAGLEHAAQSQGLMTGQPTQLQAGGNRGRRLDINFNHRGTHIFSDPFSFRALPVAFLPLPPYFLPSTSHFPPGNVKVQDAETWARNTA